MSKREKFSKTTNPLCLKKKHIFHVTKLLYYISVILTLSVVFVLDSRLANGVISGKHFWFFGSMGFVCLLTLIYAFINKIAFRFSIVDGFVFLFVGSVFLSTCVFNEPSANATRLILLALLLVLYVCVRFVLNHGQQNFFHLICFFIIITGLVEAIWGLMQLYGFKSSQHNLFKLTGSFFNPGSYAGYLAVVFPLALNYFIEYFNYRHPSKLALKYDGENKGFRFSQIVHLVKTVYGYSYPFSV